MARRKRQSTAEDIMDAVALLPWWVGVVLAIASYLLFHWLATRPQPTITDPRQVANLLIPGMVSAVSMAAQFIAPVICIAGALISFLRQKKRSHLVATVTASPTADALNGMSWREFETLVGEAFRLQGYQVKELGGPQPDGGVDLVLRKGSEVFLVQCKQWKAFKVGVDVVRELFGVMAARGAAGGFVVTSGTFTADAATFAEGRNVQLVSGTKLHALLQQAKASLERKAAVPSVSPKPPAPPAGMTPEMLPSCPTCNAPMVRRTARKGANAGAQFWGCSKYPACRGTR